MQFTKEITKPFQFPRLITHSDHIHICSYMHTYMHTYTHTCIHAWGWAAETERQMHNYCLFLSHTQTHKNTQIDTQMCTDTLTHTHMYLVSRKNSFCVSNLNRGILPRCLLLTDPSFSSVQGDLAGLKEQKACRQTSSQGHFSKRREIKLLAREKGKD